MSTTAPSADNWAVAASGVGRVRHITDHIYDGEIAVACNTHGRLIEATVEQMTLPECARCVRAAEDGVVRSMEQHLAGIERRIVFARGLRDHADQVGRANVRGGKTPYYHLLWEDGEREEYERYCQVAGSVLAAAADLVDPDANSEVAPTGLGELRVTGRTSEQVLRRVADVMREGAIALAADHEELAEALRDSARTLGQ